MKNKISVVYVDLDGVLADFVKDALKLHGIEYEGKEPNLFNIVDNKGVFDLENALGLTKNEFWKPINDLSENFWSNLKKTTESDRIMEEIEAKFPKEKIFFLTSPCKDPGCYKGKMQWVEKYYPDYCRRTILTPHKYLLAQSDRLLIDDADHNVEKFKDYGGKTLLIPRSWNQACNFRYQSLSVFLDEFSEYECR